MVNSKPSNSSDELTFNQPTNHYAIVLAAGASTRMGMCKASLPWVGGITLLAYQMAQLQDVGVMPIAVLGPHNRDRQHDCPPGSQIVINPTPSDGKTSSILIGLQHLPGTFHSVTIVAVDQPRPSWVYRRLLHVHTQTAGAKITAPRFQSHPGHPLIFARTMYKHLLQIREATLGLRQVMHTFATQVQYVSFDTPLVLTDLNTIDRYRAERQRMQSVSES